MSSCNDDHCLSSPHRADHIRVLKIVLAINAAMFVIEGVSGFLFRSVGLMGDALDMLEDALVYALSLYVVDRGPRWKARAALIKGAIMLALGAGVLAQTIRHAITGIIPSSGGMSLVGLLALTANATCLFLLFRHKDDDLNMRSTWLCSRNDVIANIGVIFAAFLVRWLHAPWPDIAIGTIIAAMILTSSIGILREARRELKGRQSQP